MSKENPLDGDVLVNALRQRGWITVGQRSGFYVRLQPSRSEGFDLQSLMVPTKRNASDYRDLMAAAISVLNTDHHDLWVRVLKPLFEISRADEILFRRESPSPSGFIPWTHGEDLISSARATLIAGAKSYMGNLPYYANKFGRFASRYLDTIQMGQTDVGSYIVTAFAPVAANVQLYGTSDAVGNLEYANIDVVSGRIVTRAVAKALTATTKAIAESRQSKNLAGFHDGVSHGVSYEIVTAIKNMVGGSDGADITIGWANDGQLLDNNEPPTKLVFQRDDAAILERAAIELAAPQPERVYTATGRVHLLTKKDVGGPGVVGIDDGKQKFRVRMESELGYHDAVLAHDRDETVTVSGRLSREGNINWLYEATLLPVSTDEGAALAGDNKMAQQPPRLFDQ